MKYLIRNITYLIMGMYGMVAVGCSDDAVVATDPNDASKDVTLTLYLPGYTSPGARSVNDSAIDGIIAVYLDADGRYIWEEPVSPDDIALAEGRYKVTLMLSPHCKTVDLVANYTGKVGCNPREKVITELASADEHVVMWGTSTVDELKQPDPQISMLRACAKTTVTSTDDSDFEIKEVKMLGMPDRGLMAPAKGIGEYTPSLSPDTEFLSDVMEVGYSSGQPFYHYEAPAKTCFLIIKGSYRGARDGYYKIAYTNTNNSETSDDPDSYLPIVRNHHYMVKITDAIDAGFDTEAEAMASTAANLKVLIKDDDETIYNMIAAGDYELGVCRDVFVKNTVTTAEIRVVTSYESGDAYPFRVEEAALPDWVDKYVVVDEPGDVGASDTHSRHRRYRLTFTLEPNVYSEEERAAVVRISSGALSREVKIIQDGADLKRAGERAGVLIYGLENHVSPYQYFDFLDNELQGVTEDATGIKRNNGIHFRIYDNRYSYAIPMLSGDNIKIFDDKGLFTVKADGSYWKVECTTAGNENYKTWTGRFALTNTDAEGHTITINYDVYHNGIFHFLSGDNQIAGPTGNKATGWYYYEQVTAMGASGATYYILDRNLGASSNRFASSNTAGAMSISSYGGYFKIAHARMSPDLIEAIPPAGYEIPEAYHFRDLSVMPLDDSHGTVALATYDSDLSMIYFPLGGYMDGSQHKYDLHSCLWSRTLLSGNQGFDSTSPEYGYWYLFLDMYGSVKSIGNMRYVGRSAEGLEGGEYKAMPVRCIKGPKVPLGGELHDPAIGRRRIFIENTKGWSKPYVVIWKEGDEEPQPIGGNSGRWIVLNYLHDQWWFADINEHTRYLRFYKGKPDADDFDASECSEIITLTSASEYTL